MVEYNIYVDSSVYYDSNDLRSVLKALSALWVDGTTNKNAKVSVKRTTHTINGIESYTLSTEFKDIGFLIMKVSRKWGFEA